jgi:hypothetical protein
LNGGLQDLGLVFDVDPIGVDTGSEPGVKVFDHITLMLVRLHCGERCGLGIVELGLESLAVCGDDARVLH